jgi:hypothetical protein
MGLSVLIAYCCCIYIYIFRSIRLRVFGQISAAERREIARCVFVRFVFYSMRYVSEVNRVEKLLDVALYAQSLTHLFGVVAIKYHTTRGERVRSK